MNKADHFPKRRYIGLKIAAITAIFAAVALILISLTDYSTARQLANRLTADGSMDSFTPERFRQLIIIMRLLAVILQSAGVTALIIPAQARFFINSVWLEIRSAFSGWPRDLIEGLRVIRGRLLRRNILLPIAVFTLLALLVRLVYINDPYAHDEAYTFAVFAKLPLRLGLSDYHFPNNHIFHTLLVHISWQLFGNDPLAVRLPALIAGVGIVPAGYLLARRLYGKAAAIITGAALVTWPALIKYAANARGYSLVALMTLLVFILAVELTHRSNRFYWSLAALISALGFYTVPVFLLPFGTIVTWLVLSGLTKRVIPVTQRISWFTRLSLFIVTTVTITGLLYLPVFFHTGLNSVISNSYIGSLSWADFWPTFGSRMQDTAIEWTSKIPTFATIIALAGLVLSVVFHKRFSREPVSTQLAAVIFIPILLLVQRPNAWEKIWQFLLPLLLIWAGAGVAAGFKVIETRIKSRFPITVVGIGLLSIGLLVLAGVNALQNHPGLRSIPGPVEQSAIYFSTHLQEKDIVVIAPVDDAPLWAYFYKYDLSQEYFRRDLPFKRAYVVVSQDQTIDDVLSQRGPDSGFLDRSTTHLVDTWGNIKLYSIDANWKTVCVAYNLDCP